MFLPDEYYETFIREFDGLFKGKPAPDGGGTEPAKRTDYCYRCNTDQLYTHAMTFKCSKCNSIILGGG